MIPKVIHYCCFGRNPLSQSAQKCIASWLKYLPDYEIKEWNEDNFDINFLKFTREAYVVKNMLLYQMWHDFMLYIKKVEYIWILM